VSSAKVAALPRNQRDPRFANAGLLLFRLTQLHQCGDLAAQLGADFAMPVTGVQNHGIDQAMQHIRIGPGRLRLELARINGLSYFDIKDNGDFGCKIGPNG
jgi:hypothetical protein